MAQAKGTNFSSANTSLLGCCKQHSSHQLPSSAVRPFLFPAEAAQQLLALAATSIPAAMNPFQQPPDHFPSSIQLLQAFQWPS
ncbi:hypothetical protein L3X38_002898 [Prunus dulcis]|uniref:Uncharacterized protein n=1 Tax=Prunus dulcis TaxID=3755 RepID=A0AAD4WYQ0_PRUDU|nr:hypothetical protein L3X38_002898 [Prunus dulcis]